MTSGGAFKITLDLKQKDSDFSNLDIHHGEQHEEVGECEVHNQHVGWCEECFCRSEYVQYYEVASKRNPKNQHLDLQSNFRSFFSYVLKTTTTTPRMICQTGLIGLYWNQYGSTRCNISTGTWKCQNSFHSKQIENQLQSFLFARNFLLEFVQKKLLTLPNFITSFFLSFLITTFSVQLLFTHKLLTLSIRDPFLYSYLSKKSAMNDIFSPTFHSSNQEINVKFMHFDALIYMLTIMTLHVTNRIIL